MKIPKVVMMALLVLVPVAIAAGIFFHSGPEMGQGGRSNLTEAQKMLVTLRRAQTAFQQSTHVYKDISAKKSGGKMIYSDGWNAMKLPSLEASTGFDFKCLPAEHACRALEPGKTGLAASGIRIDLETGIFSCLGSYKPVTTEGFDGVPVVVACQAS